jgi:D-alanine-D-alanine ligase
MGKLKRVLLLVHPRFRPDRRTKNGSSEKSIFAAVKRLGHSVHFTTADKDLTALNAALKDIRPHIVFNLIEEFRGEGIFDFHLVSYLEALSVPYTGCNPRGLALSRNKFLVMKVAQGMRVQVPKSALGSVSGEQVRPGELNYPLFVKLNREHASLGITPKNRVTSDPQLRAVCRRLKNDYRGRILIQEFVSGSDVSVSVWGNRRIDAFSPWILKLSGPDDFATEHLKFNSAYRKKHSITAAKYQGPLASQLCKSAKAVYAALDLSGYARMDFRVTAAGEAFLVDVNANPSLAETEDFADSARAEGYSYPEVIENILRLGLSYRPQV